MRRQKDINIVRIDDVIRTVKLVFPNKKSIKWSRRNFVNLDYFITRNGFASIKNGRKYMGLKHYWK